MSECITDKNGSLIPVNFRPLKKFDINLRSDTETMFEFWFKIGNDSIEDVTYITDGGPSAIMICELAVRIIREMKVDLVKKTSASDLLNCVDDVNAEIQSLASQVIGTIHNAMIKYEKSRCDNPDNCNNCDKESCDSRSKPQTKTADTEFSQTERMSKIKNKILVMSGKGGVGKSTLSVNLAVSLALAGYKTGLLDIDLHGPSIPTMLNLKGAKLDADQSGIYPAELHDINNLKVISTGFILPEDDSPAIWRGPMKASVIKQFLHDVHWGDLDYLIIDSPPGTGDEPLSVIQMSEGLTGAILVTTPQEVSSSDVSRSINFCRKLDLHIIGLIENMNGYICPVCKTKADIFQSNGGEKLAEAYGINFLGSIPLDPAIGLSCDTGKPYIQAFRESEVSEIFRKLAKYI